MAGATVQWLRDGLQVIQSAAEVESLAAQVDDTGDVYLVPAFAGLGTPDWDGYARGTLVGLTRGTTRAHVARAALEAIALQSADVFGAMSRDARIPLRELRVDGGASRNNLLMQLQADFLGVPVVRPQVTETGAGRCLPGWPGDRVLERRRRDRRAVGGRSPLRTAAGRGRTRGKLARWREAVERSKGWARP